MQAVVGAVHGRLSAPVVARPPDGDQAVAGRDHVRQLALPQRRPGARVELPAVGDARPGLTVLGGPDRHVTVRQRGSARVADRDQPIAGGHDRLHVAIRARKRRLARDLRPGQEVGRRDGRGRRGWPRRACGRRRRRRRLRRRCGGERDGGRLRRRDRGHDGFGPGAAAERGECERPGHPGSRQDEQRAGAVAALVLGLPEGLVDVRRGLALGQRREAGLVAPGRGREPAAGVTAGQVVVQPAPLVGGQVEVERRDGELARAFVGQRSGVHESGTPGRGSCYARVATRRPPGPCLYAAVTRGAP